MKVRSILLGCAAASATGVGLVLSVAGAPVSAGGEIAPALAVSASDAAADIQRLTTAAPAAQADALRDGRVSRAEYRAAVDGAIGCVVEAVEGAAADRGIDVAVSASPPQLSADGFEYSYSYEIDLPPGAVVPDDAQSALSVLQQDCQAAHMDRVATAYQVQSLSTPAFTRRVADRFVTCLRTAGVEVPASRSVGSARAVLASVLDEIAADPGSGAAACVATTPAVTADPAGSVNFVLTGSPAG